MTVDVLQRLDAFFLIGVVACLVVLMQRNYRDAPIAMRAGLAVFGVLAAGQAAWLLGIWAPDTAGFPWPRAAMDGSMLMLSALHIAMPSVFAHHDIHQPVRRSDKTAFNIVPPERRETKRHIRVV